MQHRTDVSLHEALKLVGFTSRKTTTDHRREIFDVKTKRSMGQFSAPEAWRWLQIPEKAARVILPGITGERT